MSHKIFRSFFVLIFVIGLVAIQAPQPARAAGPWYVSTTGDDNNDCLSPTTPCGTINGAIGKATAGDTINVAVGTYTDTGNEVVLIDRDIILTGGWDADFTTQNGLSTIDGQASRRGITIVYAMTVTVERFFVQNGFSESGGGIFNSGTLSLNSSMISESVARIGGGGIYNFGGVITINNSAITNNIANIGPGGGMENNAGTVTINNSTVANNVAQSFFAGGIYNYGTMSINNTTISANGTSGSGGGILAGGNGTTTINSSTITGNYGSSGGGLMAWPSVIMSNTILAQNTGGSAPDCFGPYSSGIVSGGYNLVGNDLGCEIVFTPAIGDQVGTSASPIDPLLGPLQDNGGPTFTHALLPGSPAIDAGNPAGCTDQDGNLLTTDQRGVARPQGAACDIGAFELEVANPIIEVSIDIKPGSEVNPINTKSKGKIPVAILSTADFDAPSMVDTTSLTFGKTGDETSLAFCNKDTEDVNDDGLQDLICHFYNQETGFQKGDTEGILKGATLDGSAFIGQDSIKTKNYHSKHDDDDHDEESKGSKKHRGNHH